MNILILRKYQNIINMCHLRMQYELMLWCAVSLSMCFYWIIWDAVISKKSLHTQHIFDFNLISLCAYGGLNAWQKNTQYHYSLWVLLNRQKTSYTYPGCRNWGRHSRRRSRCGVPALTCCWRCEHSSMPADKCSRRAGRSAEARWRSPAMLSESAPPSLVSTGNTCQEKPVSWLL